MELSLSLSQSTDVRSGDLLQSTASKLARLQQSNAGDASEREKEIRKAAEEFEGMFLAQMLQHMFAGIESNPLVGDSHADEVYQSMLVDEYGKMISKSGGIGVADHVMRQLLQQHETAVAQGVE